MDSLALQQLGFKFDPTEVQLILVHLYRKFRELEVPHDLIKFSNQVYTNPPGDYYSRTAFPGTEKYFCFTKLKKMNQNQNQNRKDRKDRSVGSYGTWRESTCKKIFVKNVIIGFKKLFNFWEKSGSEPIVTDWLMHEFSLPGNRTDLVLCVIHRSKNREEMGLARDTYPELDPMALASFEDLQDLRVTTSAGGGPCPAPAPAQGFWQLQDLDSEEPWLSPLDLQGILPRWRSRSPSDLQGTRRNLNPLDLQGTGRSWRSRSPSDLQGTRRSSVDLQASFQDLRVTTSAGGGPRPTPPPAHDYDLFEGLDLLFDCENTQPVLGELFSSNEE